MEKLDRKVILYIAMSLDGYIAGENDNIDFLNSVLQEGEDYGYNDFLQNIGIVIWGRKTYDKVLTFGIEIPHADKTVYVLSKSRTGHDDHVTYVDDLPKLIAELKNKPGKHIYCDGGGEVVFELLKHQLIDRLIISIIPYFVGSGVRLFAEGRPECKLKFVKAVSYFTGLIQLWYDCDAESILKTA